ncbi:cation channel sperm-associated auxiliary subunit epsilon [Latimeria chalumnae]|uniref:cation channel sperm-associated auxiliary subunit epsilon n=1 Tax=Latimeria chalumnae TaxID=7897 RepID=UPI0006D8F988|nr:PREDICTED: uncharacterized protein C1orf101 [Latimeria chalumnae]|eukprot:XP_014342511.1 PREDICTED: uncharacterized protein C1orf101 [Latimeria chalumnae]
MKNNVMFYCKVGMKKLIQLPVWELANSDRSLYLTFLGDLYFLEVDGSRALLHAYPIDMEIFSSSIVYSQTCSYITFTHNMMEPVYFLDVGHSIQFWTQIVYKEDQGLRSILSVYNSELLQTATDTNYEISNRICTKNMTVQVRTRNYANDDEDLDYQEMLKKVSGIATFEIEPNYFGNVCFLPTERVSHIAVGCPPTRRIVIHDRMGLRCKKENFTTYNIPGFVLQSPMAEDLSVEYEWAEYGCLTYVQYRKPFKPKLALYDGDTFISLVEANFIVWEIFGRTDYSFNATMEQVGCLHEAQTRKSMIKLSGFHDAALGDVWGPENYRSCFKLSSGKMGDLSQPYEIMNSTSKSYLIWPQNYTGIYVFHAKIVDPGYSFCDLRVMFAIRTYGVRESYYTLMALLLVFSLAVLVSCILLYTYFRYMKIFKKCHIPYEEEEQESENELFSKSNQELKT